MLTAAAVVACALDLLGRSPSTLPSIEFVTRVPPGLSRNVEAFIRRDPDVIVLVTSAAAFVSAQQGAHEVGHREGCRKIASVLVHEEWHLRHGSDEQGAYLAQLTSLAAIGADSATLYSVRRSMQEVVAAQRNREKAAKHALPPLPPLEDGELARK
jgi:hypothetical protein